MDEEKKTLIGIVGKENVLVDLKSLQTYAKDESLD